MVSCHSNCLELQENAWHRDVDVERIYGRRPKPLCLSHLITLQYYSLLRFFIQKLATTSTSLQLCPEITDNISWLCQNLSNLVLNVLVVLADTTQLSKLFHVGLFITLLIKPNFRRSHFASINQSLFATRFVNSRFSLPNKSNSAFLKGVWMWKLSFGTKWWKASGNRVRNFIEISKIWQMTSKPCNGKTVSGTKNLRRKGTLLDLLL